jgi:hypothetical protein
MDVFKTYPYILLMMISLMVSCVKDPQDIPGSSSADEIFGLSGSFGNEQLTIGAGTNQWTNLPVVSTGDSLQVYTSVFSQNGCLDSCVSSWIFNFYQALPGSGDPALDFQQTIQTGEKEILSSAAERRTYDVMLSTHPGLFMSGYSFWEDINASSNSFFHEYQSTVGYEEMIDVCFNSLAYTGCMYKQCISFDPVTEVPCLLRIEPKLENPRYLSLRVRPTGTPPFQVLWSNGTTAQTRVIPLQDSVAEVYAEVKVVDALGNQAQLSQTIRVQNAAVDACYFPIELSSHPNLDSSGELFQNRAEIQYIDEARDVWSSSGGVQPEQSQLTIDKVGYYGVSPQEQPTFLVEMTATILLFNLKTGESKLFKTDRLSLALSHD